MAFIFSILFIPFFLYLSDLRSSISADVNISVISEITTEPYGFTDFFLDRLNYFQTFNRSIETKYEFTSNPYLDNFYSLIPRILWKKKKNIGLNTNSFGRELGILDSKDENTSLGIGIITESYIVYKYFGLLIVLIYGTLFLLIKFINSEIFSIILIINFIFLDSFSYFISIMIYVILFSLFFKSLKI